MRRHPTRSSGDRVASRRHNLTSMTFRIDETVLPPAGVRCSFHTPSERVQYRVFTEFRCFRRCCRCCCCCCCCCCCGCRSRKKKKSTAPSETSGGVSRTKSKSFGRALHQLADGAHSAVADWTDRVVSFFFKQKKQRKNEAPQTGFLTTLSSRPPK